MPSSNIEKSLKARNWYISYLNDEIALGGPFLIKNSTKLRLYNPIEHTLTIFLQVVFFFNLSQIKSLIFCHFSLRIIRTLGTSCRLRLRSRAGCLLGSANFIRLLPGLVSIPGRLLLVLLCWGYGDWYRIDAVSVSLLSIWFLSIFL